MAAALDKQALALALALVLGILTGVCYDFFRPLRRESGRVSAAIQDALFCIIAGGGLFLFAMGADNGRMGVWELTAVLIGFLLYMHTLSAPILAFFTLAFHFLKKIVGSCKIFLKKTALLAKKFFQKAVECFIIKRKDRSAAENEPDASKARR